MQVNTAFLEIEQDQIYYKTWHKNPSADWLILLHDALGSVDQWKDFPEKLHTALGLNILAFDRVGHGHSTPSKHHRGLNYLEQESDFLQLLIDKTSLHKPYLLGHSDGGSIALLFAARQPNQCKSVISIAAHVLVEDITLNGIRKTQSQYQTKLRPLLIKYHQEKTDQLFNAWHSTWLHPHFKIWNMLDKLALINKPGLAIQGAEDKYGSRLQLEKIQLLAQAEIIEIEQCGHFPHFEKTEEVINLITHFLMD